MTETDTGVVLLEQPARRSPPRPAHKLGAIASGVGFVLGSIPTLLVLAAAGAVGWWGHHSNWTVPKFSTLNGQVRPADDWCEEHKVPESICVECNPGLLPREKQFGWCKVHGIPQCPLDRPHLAELPKPPVVTPADLKRAAAALAFADRPTNNPICKTHERHIQYATAADADKSGIEVTPVGTGPVVESVSAPGEVGYDQIKVAHLSSRSPGTVFQVYKQLGEAVRAGDVLALVDATEVGKQKAELLTAYADSQLKSRTLASYETATGAVPEVRVREAAAAAAEAEVRVNAARQALTNLGLSISKPEVQALTLPQLEEKLYLLGIPAPIAESLGAKAASTNLLPLTSPIDGTVTAFEVVAGEVVNPDRVLFEVADTHSLWLTLDLKGEDARRVRVGQPVVFKPDNGQPEATGVIAYKSSQADPKTRTVKVRANLADPEERLPANTFGAGRVILRREPEAVTVPGEAVQWDGCCSVVFVRDVDYLKPGAPKVFHVRKVRVGAKTLAATEVIAGVLPGELVVTQGSGLLLTELLRGDLGEGCACHSKK